MSHTWLVQTGDTYKSHVTARSARAAVVAAFKKRAPKHAGVLTRVEGDAGVFYIETVACLKAAGYKTP